jgi:hypothetical protein
MVMGAARSKINKMAMRMATAIPDMHNALGIRSFLEVRRRCRFALRILAPV